MVNLSKPFPFFLNDDRENFLLILGISLFIYLFVKLFRPFGALSTTLDEVHIYSFITLVVLSFNIIILPRWFPRFLDNSNWTLRKYLVFNVYNMVSITLFIALSHYFTRDIEDLRPFHLSFLNDLWRTAAIGIMPLVAMTFLLENRLMAAMLSAGVEATSQLKQMHDQVPEESNMVLTIQSEYSEPMRIDAKDFLYAQAENNYCKLITRTIDKPEEELVRIFIKDLFNQLGGNHIVRCHRSYIVNLNQVSRVSGNANGYRLHFENTENSIPVSRAMGKEVLERIERLSGTA